MFGLLSFFLLCSHLALAKPLHPKEKLDWEIRENHILQNLSSDKNGIARADEHLKQLDEQFSPNETEPILFLFRYAKELNVLPNLKKLREVYEQLGARISIKYGTESPEFGLFLNEISQFTVELGNYEEAISIQQESLRTYKESLGPEHKNTLLIQKNLGDRFLKRGKPKQGLPIFEKTQEVWKRLYGTDNIHYARIQASLGWTYWHLGQYKQSQKYFFASVQLFTQLLGPEHLETLRTKKYYGWSLQDNSQYNEAQLVYDSVRRRVQKVFGKNSPYLADMYNDIGSLYYSRGKFQQAIAKFKKNKEIKTHIYGEDSISVALSNNNIGSIYVRVGDFYSALVCFESAKEVYERQYGLRHIEAIPVYRNLAKTYNLLGLYSDAEKYSVLAVEIIEEHHGNNEPLMLANAYNGLSDTYAKLGKYEKSFPLIERSLEIYKNILGEDHLKMTYSLKRKADLLSALKRYEDAFQLYERILTIQMKSLKTTYHPSVAATLSEMAKIHQERKEFVQAFHHLKTVYEIRLNLIGEGNILTSQTKRQLAEMLLRQGKLEEALKWYESALEKQAILPGKEHADYAETKHDLALLYAEQGRQEEAIAAIDYALAIRKKNLGIQHPQTVQSLYEKSKILTQMGNHKKALINLSMTLQLQENLLRKRLQSTNATEKDKSQFFERMIGDSLDYAISLHLNHLPNSQEASHLAFQTLFQRKGRILDSQSNLLASLRESADPESLKLIENWQNALNDLSRFSLQKPMGMNNDLYKKELERLKGIESEYERALAKKSTLFKKNQNYISVEKVAQGLPNNSALIELVVHKPKDGAHQYVAAILSNTGQQKWFVLGDMEEINVLASTLIKQVKKRKAYQKTAKELYTKVLKPFEQYFKGREHILISPDGQLNLIPFEMLVNEQNKHFIEEYHVSYLSSGRDILQYSNSEMGERASVIIAHPTYDKREKMQSAAGEHRNVRGQSLDLHAMYWANLSGTKEEAEVIRPFLGEDSQLVMEQQATEKYLKGVRSPKILHIATHGYFLDDIESAESGTRSFQFTAKAKGILSQKPRQEKEKTNPLLRSGIVLAGVNNRHSGDGEDGVVTALEFAALSLRGTKLVTLSACETGVGEVKNGEGVFGLRRAIVLSGAETSLMSLWSVSDEGTKNLMTQYYQKLTQGEERSQALREIQLKLMKSKEFQHPFFWASFILSGNWKSMNGEQKDKPIQIPKKTKP